MVKIIHGVEVSKCRFYNPEYDLDFSACGHICQFTECEFKRKSLLKQVSNLQNDYNFTKYEYETLEENYDKLTDKIAELREKYLSVEWLDKQNPHALGEVVGCPESVLYYLDKYIEEIVRK